MSTNTCRNPKVMLFGDPLLSEALPNVTQDKIDNICHDGDLICEDGGVLVSLQHLNYQDDAQAAAEFIASKVTLAACGKLIASNTTSTL